MASITIMELETIINRCARAHPPYDYKIGGELRALANVYGVMIYRRQMTIELSSLPRDQQEVITKWRSGAAERTEAPMERAR